jgi:ribosomal-protein-alanine N-acetyltransferase
MVTLKPANVSDAELIFQAWGQHRENFTYLTARAFAQVTDARSYLEGIFANPGSSALHILEPGGRVVGLVKAIVSGHRAQVGYVVHEPFRGRGFATQAVELLVARLQELPSISRIWATCALDNGASVRVLEKCGFEREAVLKSWVIYPALGERAFDNYSYVRLPPPQRGWS